MTKKSRSRGLIGSPSPGHGHNWLNDTAREINHEIRRARQSAPSTKIRQQWHEQYLQSGAQYRMTFVEFAAAKTKAWREQREQAAWTFGTGKFRGKRIDTTIRHNIDYITWVLENQPRGKTAKQIIHYITLNPGILTSVKRKK